MQRKPLTLVQTILMAMLREGRVVQVSTPQELYDAPVDRETALFVGSPQINLLRAAITGEGSAIETAWGTLPLPPHMRGIAAANGEFELGLRPEDLELAPDARTGLSALLVDVEPLGLKSVLTVENAPGKAAFRLRLLTGSSHARALELGQPVGITLPDAGRLLAFDVQSGRSLLL